MEAAEFQRVKAALDAELDKLPSEANVGILVGVDLYDALRQRGMLAPKKVDMVFWNWLQSSYRGWFVYDDLDMPDTEFKVGTADGRGT